MKKAFDANVSRAKPRVRLGALMTETAVTEQTVEALARQIAQEPAPVIPSVETPDLGAAIRARAFARAAKPSAAEALQEAIATTTSLSPAGERAYASAEPVVHAAPVAHVAAPVAHVAAPVAHVAAPVAHVAAPVAHVAPAVGPSSTSSDRPEAVVTQHVTPHAGAVAMPAPTMAAVLETLRASAEPPPGVTEVQTAPPPSPDFDPAERRERLRERLKAVRENPRPEPLPDTVAEAGVLAVERISALQSELSKARAMNLALAQDLEAARRQAERATEEARLRMDEAKRLATEMEGRVTLLSELERELEALEGERNESLLALQESRQVLELREREKQELTETVAKKDQEISDSLAEEERLAAELETAQETMASLRRSSDALKGERDTLARQVSELTRERAELLEARKALEAVHRALSSAAMR
jgi:hypothetical protein